MLHRTVEQMKRLLEFPHGKKFVEVPEENQTKQNRRGVLYNLIRIKLVPTSKYIPAGPNKNTRT